MGEKLGFKRVTNKHLKLRIRTLLTILEAEGFLKFKKNELYELNPLMANKEKQEIMNYLVEEICKNLHSRNKNLLEIFRYSLEKTKTKKLSDLTAFADIELHESVIRFFGLRREYLSDKLRKYLKC